MNAGSKTILTLTVVGLILLAASPWYFHFPLFGWAITLVVAMVFLFGQERYRRGFLMLEQDENDLRLVRTMDKPTLEGTSVVARRILQVQGLAARGVRPDARVFSDILSAEESARGGRGPSGLVILLGLMGTFWGLMVSIESAGGALNVQNAADAASSSDVILTATKGLFAGMMGSFGTSLCGLVAALILNFCHSILASRQLKHMAAVEEFTQFQLLPFYFPAEAPGAKAMENLAMEIKTLSESLKTSLGEREKKTAEELGKAIASLGNSLAESSSGLRKATEESVAALGNSVQNSHKAMEASLANSAQELRKATQESVQALQAAVQSSADKMSSASAQGSEKMLAAIEKAGEAASQAGDVLSAKAAQAFSGSSERLEASVTGAAEKLSDSVAQAAGRLSIAAEAIAGSATASAESAREQVARAAAESLSALRGESLREMKAAADEFSSAFQSSASALSDQLSDRWNEAATRSAEPLRALSESAAETGKRLTELLDGARMRVEGQAESVAKLDASLDAAAQLIRINQAEFQASLDMFRKGVESLLERLSGEGGEDQQRAFLSRLETTLEAFQERAGEVLSENALRTQEILIDLLEQVRGGAGRS